MIKIEDKDISKNEFSFNLKLTKDELAYLLKNVMTRHKYLCRTYDFIKESSDDFGDKEYQIYIAQKRKKNQERNKKMEFLLGLRIKLKNKYLELG